VVLRRFVCDSQVLSQLDDDPLFQTFPDGASVVAKSLKDITVPAVIIIGERDKQFGK
jgi:hypothetical protein